MSGFLAKFRVITLGAVHDLLDKQIDMNSPSVIRQYTRDLEDALDRMKGEAANQAGNVRTLKREKAELEGRIKTTEATIERLVAGGHEDLARPKAADLVRMREKFSHADENIATAQKASSDLDIAVANLENKHATMVDRVRTLESLDRDTKAKEDTKRTLQAAGRLVQGGADINVDDVESRMRRRNDAATEGFNRALGETAVQENADTAAAVDDVLKEFSKKKDAFA